MCLLRQGQRRIRSAQNWYKSHLFGRRYQLRRLRTREVMALEVEGEIHQRDHHRYFYQRPDHCRERSAGVDANTDTVTAMANSKLFEAAVNESVAVRE